MTLSLKQLFFMICVGLLMHSCSYKPISYQPTTMQIPEPAKKGEVSWLGTVGGRHFEVQLAYAPINRLALQGGIFVWGRGPSGSRYSRNIGLGYIQPIGANHQFGFRGIFGKHEGFFDQVIYHNKKHSYGARYFNDYLYHSYGVQIDYTHKMKNVNFCFGAQLSRADYTWSTMLQSDELSQYPNGPYIYNHHRQNFQTNFIHTSAGILFHFNDFLSFYSCYTTTSLATLRNIPAGEFQHSFDKFFMSNSIIITLRK